MGGCATKPKVLKGDDGGVPSASAAPEAKEGADVAVDDEATNKGESLGNLLNGTEKKGAGETEAETDDQPPLKLTETKPVEAVATAAVDVTETEKKETSAAGEDETAK
ncbi:uncharacterized protein LOC120118564 [Hibiscus syriacus]|uniref:uncharacterized protein LOC120118564 n=1 Tax=Hibiscus syriacus TaxID=106335 RepID=UPI001920E142|nr:uncharacterized protein LOC120118564 [Hibiscus syriacus]